jgi:hypothetical protein
MARAYDPSIENDFDLLSDYADSMSSVATDAVNNKDEELSELFSSLSKLFADLRDEITYTPDVELENVIHEMGGLSDNLVPEEIPELDYQDTSDDNGKSIRETIRETVTAVADESEPDDVEPPTINLNTTINNTGMDSRLEDLNDESEEANESLRSIDDSLKDLMAIESKKMRQSRIKTESTPFDALIAAAQRGEKTPTGQYADSSGGLFLPDFGGRGGRDNPNDDPNRKQTKAEKYKKYGGRAAKIAALGAIGYFGTESLLQKWGFYDEEPAKGTAADVAEGTAVENEGTEKESSILKDNALGLAAVGTVGAGTVINHYMNKSKVPVDDVSVGTVSESTRTPTSSAIDPSAQPAEPSKPTAKPAAVSPASSDSVKTTRSRLPKAGLAGIAVSGIMLGSDIFDQRSQQYSSESEKNKDTAGLVGGFAAESGGALAGGLLGAKAGAAAGLLFGPGAAVASPILAAVGGVVGSIGGALAASESGISETAAQMTETVYEAGEEFVEAGKDVFKKLNIFGDEDGSGSWFKNPFGMFGANKGPANMASNTSVGGDQTFFKRLQFWNKDSTTNVSNAAPVSNQGPLYSAVTESSVLNNKAPDNYVTDANVSNIAYSTGNNTAIEENIGAASQIRETQIHEVRERFTESDSTEEIAAAVGDAVSKSLDEHQRKQKVEERAPKASMVRATPPASVAPAAQDSKSQSLASTRPSLNNTPVMFEDSTLTLINAGYL